MQMYVEEIREILSRHGRLFAPVSEISDGSDLYEAGLTSLATVGVMLALEEEFDIEFPDSMLSRKTFASIESLAAAVQRLIAKGDSPAEAIAKWKEKLDACPQEGDLLLWRVQPEIEWGHDFDMQKPVWRVYARITIQELWYSEDKNP